MLQNGQIYFKNLVVFTRQVLNYVWLFFSIMHEKLNIFLPRLKRKPELRHCARGFFSLFCDYITQGRY